ncbi:hypothetical protein CYMTET_27506 [Cymbomonas tetramitiformis]|uniref:DRBM domain-containing protein n=1 Tax=Cymbomonas tetramitiformis TaxID=36881 RepID=A0AAE0FPP2_9CHLO|nr:hypothetical protein CYMTET_27506 [Cymbomonas tetramitiformis]
MLRLPVDSVIGCVRMLQRTGPALAEVPSPSSMSRILAAAANTGMKSPPSAGQVRVDVPSYVSKAEFPKTYSILARMGNNKTPLMLINEYSSRKSQKVVFEESKEEDIYKANANINGVPGSGSSATSKQEAKQLAACACLETLLGQFPESDFSAAVTPRGKGARAVAACPEYWQPVGSGSFGKGGKGNGNMSGQKRAFRDESAGHSEGSRGQMRQRTDWDGGYASMQSGQNDVASGGNAQMNQFGNRQQQGFGLGQQQLMIQQGSPQVQQQQSPMQQAQAFGQYGQQAQLVTQQMMQPMMQQQQQQLVQLEDAGNSSNQQLVAVQVVPDMSGQFVVHQPVFQQGGMAMDPYGSQMQYSQGGMGGMQNGMQTRSTTAEWSEFESKLPGKAPQTVWDTALNLPGPHPETRENCPVLYRDRNGWCLYSERVWLGLLYKGIPFDEVLVDNQGSKPRFWYDIGGGTTPAVVWPDGTFQVLARALESCLNP